MDEVRVQKKEIRETLSLVNEGAANVRLLMATEGEFFGELEGPEKFRSQMRSNADALLAASRKVHDLVSSRYGLLDPNSELVQEERLAPNEPAISEFFGGGIEE